MGSSPPSGPAPPALQWHQGYGISVEHYLGTDASSITLGECMTFFGGLILYVGGLCFRNGSGSWVSSCLHKKTTKIKHKKTWKINKGHWETSVEKKICPNERVLSRKGGHIYKSNLATSEVPAWRREKTQEMWSDAEEEKTGLAQSFSKLIINGTLESPVTESRVWLVFIHCTQSNNLFTIWTIHHWPHARWLNMKDTARYLSQTQLPLSRRDIPRVLLWSCEINDYVFKSSHRLCFGFLSFCFINPQ